MPTPRTIAISIDIKPTRSDVWPPTIARAISSRATSSVPKGCCQLGGANEASGPVRGIFKGIAFGLARQIYGPTKQKRNMHIKAHAPTTAARLRIKRSKMIRAWLRRFCTNSVVSSRNGSTSSCVWEVPRCSEISMAVSFHSEGVDEQNLRVTNARIHHCVEDIRYQIETNNKHSAKQ